MTAITPVITGITDLTIIMVRTSTLTIILTTIRGTGIKVTIRDITAMGITQAMVTRAITRDITVMGITEAMAIQKDTAVMPEVTAITAIPEDMAAAGAMPETTAMVAVMDMGEGVKSSSAAPF